MTAPALWKEFEGNEVTHSVAHHLAAVHDLREQHGYARVSDVARYLGITRGSASLTLKALREKHYVQEDRNKFLSLSDKGHRIVHNVLAKRRIMETFLKEVLRVEEKQAEIDACKVEHLLSAEAGENLCHFVSFLLSETPAARLLLEEYWRERDSNPDSASVPM